MLNLDKPVKTSLKRWERRDKAEEKTPYLIEHRRGWKHPRLMRLGRVRILDWGDGPRLDYGSGTIYGVPSGLDSLRIPSEADAAAIDKAIIAMNAAQAAADRIFVRAFKRGRRPTIGEIQETTAQMQSEAPE